MAEESTDSRRRRFWTIVVAIIIALIFLYYYQPFEEYVVEGITHIRSTNIIFWFASLVAVVAYAIAHWQTFTRRIYRHVTDLDAEALVFDTLQISILTAIIFCAGAILQAVEMLSEHLIAQGSVVDGAFGSRLLTIILLVILAIAFYLLHYLVRAFRGGWRPKRPPGRGARPSADRVA
jgi:hypothetical protein